MYYDEIKSIHISDGSQIWSEVYKDIPIYQAKGGQITNFLNILFFILPNNSVGSFDVNLGLVHNSVLNEIPFISSINNSKDKIYIYENYLVYLDEGKYLYTINLLRNDFTIFKKNINLSYSNKFFNNSIILKEGKYIQAININNGKTFWLIEIKDVSSNSKIVAIRSIGKNIEIFLNDGDVLVINNKKLIEKNNLDIKNIKSIYFKNKKIIVNTHTGKTVVF